MKKVGIFLIIAVLALSLCSCAQNDKASQEAITVPNLTVNGEKVSREEYLYFYKLVRSQIIVQYAQDYSVTDFSDFWETEFDGETPMSQLEEKTLSECVKAKIILSLCKENDIYQDISFEALQLKAQKFNEENEGKSGVVGLKSISLDSFYTYYIDTGVMELKNKLEQAQLKPNEEEIQLQIDAMTQDVKAELSQDEIRVFAIEKAVDEKYDKLIEQKISDAVIEKE